MERSIQLVDHLRVTVRGVEVFRWLRQAQEVAQQGTLWVFFRTHLKFSESNAKFCFFLGQTNPLVKELKNPLVHYRPRVNKFWESLPYRVM